jgi:hypothetical protein
MADRDAFGNERSDTPSPGIAAPTPTPGLPPTAGLTPTPTPKPVAPATRSRQSRTSGRRKRSRGLALFVIGITVIRIIVQAAHHTSTPTFTVPSFVPSLPSFVPTTPDSVPAVPTVPSTGEPVGLGPRSMLRAPAFRSAVARVHGNDPVRGVLVEPDEVIVATTHRGRYTILGVDFAGDTFNSLPGVPHTGTSHTFSRTLIDVDAPSRFLRHTGHSLTDLNFLILEYSEGTLLWRVSYTDSNVEYTADRHGNHVHREVDP